MSARTAALALGSAQSCLKSSHYMLQKNSLEHKEPVQMLKSCLKALSVLNFTVMDSGHRIEERQTGRRHGTIDNNMLKLDNILYSVIYWAAK